MTDAEFLADLWARGTGAFGQVRLTGAEYNRLMLACRLADRSPGPAAYMHPLLLDDYIERARENIARRVTNQLLR